MSSQISVHKIINALPRMTPAERLAISAAIAQLDSNLAASLIMPVYSLSAAAHQKAEQKAHDELIKHQTEAQASKRFEQTRQIDDMFHHLDALANRIAGLVTTSENKVMLSKHLTDFPGLIMKSITDIYVSAGHLGQDIEGSGEFAQFTSDILAGLKSAIIQYDNGQALRAFFERTAPDIVRRQMIQAREYLSSKGRDIDPINDLVGKLASEHRRTTPGTWSDVAKAVLAYLESQADDQAQVAMASIRQSGTSTNPITAARQRATYVKNTAHNWEKRQSSARMLNDSPTYLPAGQNA